MYRTTNRLIGIIANCTSSTKHRKEVKGGLP